jgi:hypothetical protein
MMEEDRFADVQKAAPAETSFLRADLQSRREKAAARAAAAAQNRRRAERNGQLLLEALRKAGRPIPEDLVRELSSADAAEAAIARAFDLLHPPGPSAASTDRQLEIAKELGAGERRETFAHWLSQQPAAVELAADLHIDRHLAELEQSGIDPSSYASRAAAIREGDPARRSLLADSLLVELSKAVRESRATAEILSDLRARSAELAPYQSNEARAIRASIEDALNRRDVSAAASLLAQANTLIEQEMQALAFDARRRAVLRGLSELGYEVNEGMATAWVESGQVVLRRTASPGYGVHLAGGTKSDRLQVRAVAFSDPHSSRDAGRDRDVETVWCSDFDKLRAMLSKAGTDIEIEQALPVGSIPLKVVEDPGAQVSEKTRDARMLGR